MVGRRNLSVGVNLLFFITWPSRFPAHILRDTSSAKRWLQNWARTGVSAGMDGTRAVLPRSYGGVKVSQGGGDVSTNIA